jgi:hypothetical protein
VAVEVTPLGFKKPDGSERVRDGDNVISDNAQKADDLLLDARANIANLLTAAGFPVSPIALNDDAVAAALALGGASSTALDARLGVKVPPLVAAYIAADPSVVTAAATMAASTVGLVPVWKASTAYVAGQLAIAPNGDIVSAKVNFTSGSSYNAANWNPSTDGATLATMAGRELPDRGRATVASHTSADNITTNGDYQIWISTDASGLGLPSANAGQLKVYTVNTIIHQMYIVLAAGWKIYYRRRASGVWSAWESPIDTINTALSNRITPFETTSKAYVSVSRSAGTAYFMTGPLGITQRQPFRTGGNTKSFRIWFHNYDERSNTAYTGQCDISGVWMGPAAVDSDGNLTGQFASAPVQVSGAITGPTDGSAFSTALVFPATFTISPNVDYLISYGLTTGSGTQHRSQGQCWTTASTANASQQTTTATATPGKFSVLDTWVEVNTTSPRVAMVGDSHTACGAADLAVFDSVINKYAFANGVVPVNVGAGGSTFAEWSTLSDRRWQKYFTNSAGADAWILALGQNDIYNSGLDLATVQANFKTVAAIGKQVFGPNMHLVTVKPRNIAGQEAYNAIRIQFNDWLRTLPCRAVNIFDIAAAVTDSTGNTIDSRYVLAADNTHAPTAGTAVEARAITARLGSKNV